QPLRIVQAGTLQGLGEHTRQRQQERPLLLAERPRCRKTELEPADRTAMKQRKGDPSTATPEKSRPPLLKRAVSFLGQTWVSGLALLSRLQDYRPSLSYGVGKGQRGVNWELTPSIPDLWRVADNADAPEVGARFVPQPQYPGLGIENLKPLSENPIGRLGG